MTENPIHRDASPELRTDLYHAVIRKLEDHRLSDDTRRHEIPFVGFLTSNIVEAILPIIASVDANAHARGRAEAVEVAASLMTQTDEIPPGGERCRCSVVPVFNETTDDSRNDETRGHVLDAASCRFQRGPVNRARFCLKCVRERLGEGLASIAEHAPSPGDEAADEGRAVLGVVAETEGGETYAELDDWLAENPNAEAVGPSPEETVLLRVERALEAHFDAADGTIPAALVRSGIRSALNAATNEFTGW